MREWRGSLSANQGATPIPGDRCECYSEPNNSNAMTSPIALLVLAHPVFACLFACVFVWAVAHLVRWVWVSACSAWMAGRARSLREQAQAREDAYNGLSMRC